MKPNQEVESITWLSRYDDPNRRGGSFPRIGFEYQARREGGFNYGGDQPPRPPGFTRLAREVFRRDESRTVRLERAVLGFVTLATAWPLATTICEVVRLLKNGGL